MLNTLLKTTVVAAALAAGVLGCSIAADLKDRAHDTETFAFDHMSINVADFDGAMAWYQDKLGFEVDVAWQVAALDGKRLAYLSLGDTVIELVAADEGGIGLPAARTFAEHFGRTGFGHLCFIVADVDATLTALEAKGVPTFVQAETYPLDGTSYERRVGFIQDPEGNVIEFAEPLRTRVQ